MREGDVDDTSFDFKGDQWFTRLTGKFKMSADLDLTENYQSGHWTIRQEITEYLFMDFGALKKIFQGKPISNLNMRDVFASRIQEGITDRPNFYLRDFSHQGRA